MPNSDTENHNRRHECVANLDEVPERNMEQGKRFGCTMKSLGRATGAKGIGCTWYEQPPGRTAFPRHYHCANEESVFVLEGQGTVHIGDTEFSVNAGDYVTFRVGPENAHKVVNTGAVPLRYLCFSTLHSVEIVGYPDSKKLGAMALPRGSTFTDPPWVRAIVREDDQVGYYEGEEVD